MKAAKRSKIEYRMTLLEEENERLKNECLKKDQRIAELEKQLSSLNERKKEDEDHIVFLEGYLSCVNKQEQSDRARIAAAIKNEVEEYLNNVDKILSTSTTYY
jgi:predicted nuclease with TOPRIM domain